MGWGVGWLASLLALVATVGCDDKANPGAPDASDGVEAGSVTGGVAFPVQFAWMNPSDPDSICNWSVLRDASVPAASIVLYESAGTSALCADGGPTAMTGHEIDIAVATAPNPPGVAPLSQQLPPGPYPVTGSICFPLVPTGPVAQLSLGQAGEALGDYATSGAVTIETVTADTIGGSFDVTIGSPCCGQDGGPPFSLSGSFQAVSCP